MHEINFLYDIRNPNTYLNPKRVLLLAYPNSSPTFLIPAFLFCLRV